MLERGAFDGAHAAMMVHPWPADRLASAPASPSTTSTSHFTGQERPRLRRSPRGVNAADAMTVAQVAIGLLRQQLRAGRPGPRHRDQRRRRRQHHPRAGDRAGSCAGHLRSPTWRPSSPGQALLRGGGARHRVPRSNRATSPRPTRTWSRDAGCSPATGATPRRSGARFDRDDDGLAPPTISTDMANVSLAVPTIHPMIGIDAARRGQPPAGVRRGLRRPTRPTPPSSTGPSPWLDGHRRRHRPDARATGCWPGGRGRPDALSQPAGLVDAELVAQHVGRPRRAWPTAASASLHGHQQVLGAPGRRLHVGQGGVDRRLVALAPAPSRPLDLGALQGRVDREDLARLGLVVDEAVHPDHDLLPVVDGLGVGVGGLLDLVLHEAGLDGGDRTAHGVDPLEVVPRARRSTSSVSDSTK